MYVLEYLIYHLRPYGVINNPQPLPQKLSLENILKETAIKNNLIVSEESETKAVS